MNEYYKQEIFKYAIKMAMEHGQEIRMTDRSEDSKSDTLGTLMKSNTKEYELSLYTFIPGKEDEDLEEDEDL